MRLTGEQKRKITELESQITADKTVFLARDEPRYSVRSPTPIIDLTKSPTKSKKPLAEKSSKSKREHKKNCKNVSSTKQSVLQKIDESVPPLSLTQCCCEAGSCLKSMKELLEKEVDSRQAQVSFIKNCTTFYEEAFKTMLKVSKNILIIEFWMISR